MAKILVIEIAALGHDFLLRANGGEELAGLRFRPVESVFPAVTCAVQASFRTGEAPARHGMVGNGFYSRELARPFFWEQSSSLVAGARIWEGFRRAGRTVGVMFWQQSLGRDADVVLSPAPVHRHHGGMIQDCFARPPDLYRKLCKCLGRPFRLDHYWGPRASVKSTAWIAEATVEVMRTYAPDLLLTYLPHLDYDLQRFGPASAEAVRAFRDLKPLLEMVTGAAGESGYRVLAFGDYAMSPVARAVHPNRVLREAGLLAMREIRGMAYPDLWTSRAFAVVDHQVAHVVIRDAADAPCVAETLGSLPGVARVLDGEAKREMGIDHPRAGDLVLVAERDSWFAYPWWRDRSEAPEYAAHVDIHQKPGYDPCELFWGTWPISTSTDAARVRGSHGLTGRDLPATWASDFELGGPHGTLIDLSRALKAILEEKLLA